MPVCRCAHARCSIVWAGGCALRVGVFELRFEKYACIGETRAQERDSTHESEQSKTQYMPFFVGNG